MQLLEIICKEFSELGRENAMAEGGPSLWYLVSGSYRTAYRKAAEEMQSPKTQTAVPIIYSEEEGSLDYFSCSLED